jgi:hypothetical protein
MDDDTMTAGLLMEAAQAQQRLADASLKKFKAQVSDLGVLVREEVRQTLSEELQAVASDSRNAAEALRRLRRSAGLNLGLWSIAVTALCSGVALAIAWWMLPSRAEIAALRARRDEYAQAVAALEQQGGRVELRHCGNGHRLCVRVDRRSPAFGEAAEYLIVKGY